MSYSEPYTAYQPTVAEPRSRAVPRLLSGILGLVLTPVALGLLSYGGLREQNEMAMAVAHRDAQAIALLAGGAILLLVVAALGAWSSTGPLLGGLVWGVLPGVVGLAMPEWDLRLLHALPFDLMSGAIIWLFSGGLIAAGFLLVGTGLTATLVRRRR
jgi:hypothetical protein